MNTITQEQIDKIDAFQAEGYIWNKEASLSACGIVMDKGDDRYFFGLDGTILHNPEGFTIKIK